MKRKFLPIVTSIALVFSALSSNAQMLQNGNFEQQVQGGQLPGWVAIGGNVSQQTEINVNTQSGQVTIPSNGGERFIVLGNTQTVAGIRSVKQAITTTPKGLRFQCMNLGADFRVGILMTKAADTDTAGETFIDTVLNVGATIPGQRFPWQTFTLHIPDSMYQGLTPDSVVVTFIAATTQGAALALDDVTFIDYGLSTGAVSLFTGDLELYPNPVSDNVNLSYTINMETNVRIDIYDIQGRLISNVLNESQYNGQHIQSVDVSDLTNGVYIFRVTVGEQTNVVKFVKN